MQMIGVARLGNDAELRHTPTGTAVANMSLAFNYGRKDGEGKRPTQWVDASLWGALAEALIDYLVKGQQVSVTIEDPHIETFDGRNGPVSKLAGRIITIELVGGKSDSQRQAPTQQQAPRPASAQAPAHHQNPPAGFDNFDDDIPF